MALARKSQLLTFTLFVSKEAVKYEYNPGVDLTTGEPMEIGDIKRIYMYI
jgi:hypothetical protein